MTYRDVLAHLEALQMHKIKLGLEAWRTSSPRLGILKASSPSSMSLEPTARDRCVRRSLRFCLLPATAPAFSPHLQFGARTLPHRAKVYQRTVLCRSGQRICRVLGGEQVTYFEFTTAQAPGSRNRGGCGDARDRHGQAARCHQRRHPACFE